MKRFEFMHAQVPWIKVPSGDEQMGPSPEGTAMLDALGRQGWEVVHFASVGSVFVYCFKRKVKRAA